MQKQKVHELIQQMALQSPDAIALLYRQQQVSYQQLQQLITRLADQLKPLELGPGARVAIYLPKQVGMVASMFAASAIDCVFVPVNPLLKPVQVKHILHDSQASVLITSEQRADMLHSLLSDCSCLQHLGILEDKVERLNLVLHSLAGHPSTLAVPDHLAAILYTSGSTGLPKGVMLSQYNLLLGAASVNQYLEITAVDRLLAVLPFSFDYGLSQLISTFMAGASLVLMDYLLPRDVIRAISKYQITGLAGIPTLWKQLAALEWDDGCGQTLRYLTSSGGVMPVTTTGSLREKLPNTNIYLMYGLTEAFRSTYLPSAQIDKRPDSIGIPIPHAELHLINSAGEPCTPGETGQLVHAGSLVTLGYWNDPARTAKRYRPLSGSEQLAVWSGDLLRQDAQGYYYFMGRMDAMIKTSGYRVSPGEIESVAHTARPHTHLAAIGVPHPVLGQAILLVLENLRQASEAQLFIDVCKQQLPQYMVPLAVESSDRLPHNANGKIDRIALARQYKDYFSNINSL